MASVLIFLQYGTMGKQKHGSKCPHSAVPDEVTPYTRISFRAQDGLITSATQFSRIITPKLSYIYVNESARFRANVRHRNGILHKNSEPLPTDISK